MNIMNTLADDLATKMDHLLIRLNVPGTDESDRAAIWCQAGLKPEVAIFDLDEIFGRLKDAVCKRPKEMSWFQWMQWVFWGLAPPKIDLFGQLKSH
jgi:hypothetical protein